MELCEFRFAQVVMHVCMLECVACTYSGRHVSDQPHVRSILCTFSLCVSLGFV